MEPTTELPPLFNQSSQSADQGGATNRGRIQRKSSRQYEAYVRGEAQKDRFLGTYETEADAAAALSVVAHDAKHGGKRDSFSFSNASSVGRTGGRAGTGASTAASSTLYEPTRTWLFGLPGADAAGPSRRRRREKANKARGPKRCESSMATFGRMADPEMEELKMELSWVLAGEMPGMDLLPGGDDAAAVAEREELAAAKELVAEQRQALLESKKNATAQQIAERKAKRQAAIKRKQERQAVAEAELAKEQQAAALDPLVGQVLHAAMLDHQSQYRLERTIGEDGWTQELDDAFQQTVNQLNGHWRGLYRHQYGFIMVPTSISCQEMDELLSILADGKTHGGPRGVVEQWLANADAGQKQLNASLAAVKYKLGVMEQLQGSAAAAECCLQLNVPKPEPDEPLRATVQGLATVVGTVGPTAPAVRLDAIESVLSDGGAVAAVLRCYTKSGEQYTFVCPQPPTEETTTEARRQRIAAAEEWWTHTFLLTHAALQLAAETAAKADEDGTKESWPAKWKLHQPDDDQALVRLVRQALTEQHELDAVPGTGADIKWTWVSAEVERVAAGLRVELQQREIAQAVDISLPRHPRAADNSRLTHKVAANDPKPREEIARCSERLANLEVLLAGRKLPRAQQQQVLRDRVKVLATRAAWRLESGHLEDCIVDCTEGLQCSAEAEDKCNLATVWGVVLLKLRATAYEGTSQYDRSSEDSTAAFQRSRHDPTSQEADTERWLFQTEANLRWPQLALAAEPTRPLSKNAVSRRAAAKARQEAEVRKTKLLALTSQLSPSAARSDRSAVEAVQDAIGVSALWLLEWSEANAISGYSDWYLGAHSVEGQRVVTSVMKTMKGGCSEKTARRGTAKTLEELGVARPLASMITSVKAWTASANKTGKAGDLNMPLLPGPSVNNVVRSIVTPATQFLPGGTSFATGILPSAGVDSAAVGSGRATHTVVHPRDGTWWSLVHGLIVHTLGWVEGNEARSDPLAKLKHRLHQHEAALASVGQRPPLYWLDFLAMSQQQGGTADAGLAQWLQVTEACGQCVYLVGEPADTSPNPHGGAPALITPPARLFTRTWCCAELLLANASLQVEVTATMSFAALHSLAERLRFGPATPRPMVTAELEATWLDMTSAVSLHASKSKDARDRAPLLAAVKRKIGLNIADRKLVSMARGTLETVTKGLLDYFIIHGTI